MTAKERVLKRYPKAKLLKTQHGWQLSFGDGSMTPWFTYWRTREGVWAWAAAMLKGRK